MVGVAGCDCGALAWARARAFGGGVGEANGLIEELEVSNTPRVSTSRVSRRSTVPSARKACSKSSSVREIRR